MTISFLTIEGPGTKWGTGDISRLNQELVLDGVDEVLLDFIAFLPAILGVSPKEYLTKIQVKS